MQTLLPAIVPILPASPTGIWHMSEVLANHLRERRKNYYIFTPLRVSGIQIHHEERLSDKIQRGRSPKWFYLEATQVDYEFVYPRTHINIITKLINYQIHTNNTNSFN